MSNTESAVRSRAKRLGFSVVKSRRDGTYGLKDANRKTWVLPFVDGYSHGYDLTTINEHLSEYGNE